MVQSMTGYGKARGMHEDKSISVELKSLNSRYFDLRMSAPNEYKSREIDFRNILSEQLRRGKINMNIVVDSPEGEEPMILNEALIERYFKKLSELKVDLNIKDGDILNTIFKIPSVLKEPVSTLNKREWEVCKEILHEAVQNLIQYRKSEGKALSADMKSRIVNILNELDKIEKHEKSRAKYMRKRMYDHLDRYIDTDNVDPNRYEQEVIYYMEKMDITEEKVRLQQHCSYFLDILMTSKTEKGRKLKFIAQEIGREINTMGAKANYSEIQHIVVHMKDELEKIKEQINNVVLEENDYTHSPLGIGKVNHRASFIERNTRTRFQYLCH